MLISYMRSLEEGEGGNLSSAGGSEFLRSSYLGSFAARELTERILKQLVRTGVPLFFYQYRFDHCKLAAVSKRYW